MHVHAGALDIQVSFHLENSINLAFETAHLSSPELPRVGQPICHQASGILQSPPSKGSDYWHVPKATFYMGAKDMGLDPHACTVSSVTICGFLKYLFFSWKVFEIRSHCVAYSTLSSPSPCLLSAGIIPKPNIFC